MAKRIDSLRQSSGNGNVVRMISTRNGLVDKRWIEDLGINRSSLPKFIVVKYDETIDKYLPNNVRGLPFWDDDTYNELNTLIPVPTEEQKRNKRKPEKFEKAMELFKLGDKSFLTFDNFNDAQNKYIEWCKNYCSKDIAKLGVSKDCSDD